MIPRSRPVVLGYQGCFQAQSWTRRRAAPPLLVECGFPFDPLAGEEASTLGRLTILEARMNPDLAMGDELLKRTGSGNLVMVLGEPDVDVRPAGDGQLQVEIHGRDVYDPTTGEPRSSSVDDIAARFLGTAYDRDAYFVPPRLLHRRRRPLQQAPPRPPRRHQ